MTSVPPSDRDTWAHINDLFHRALELPADRRDSFLDTACAGEPAIRAEVASLLSAHDRADVFMEKPAAGVEALTSVSVAADASLVGQQVGHYQILRVIGGGGMGVVYLAEDTRLGRAIALKALASRFIGDATRRERLRREARAAAALTHPGIATVYALEEIGDHLYIASEYIPGETLREELAREPAGPIKAVDTVLALARALAAAHERGVVHRDLKPENIIRTTAGDVKILDFGLARFTEVTDTLVHLTAEGAVMGTPAYMSPEQIRGQTVDARSDLFSLGIIFYELITGVNPFKGVDSPATIARILEIDPPPIHGGIAGQVPGAAWSDLQAVIATCLRKTPSARFGSATDVVEALESIRGNLGSAGQQSSHVSRPASFGSGGLAAVATAQARWWWMFHQAAASGAYALMLVPLWLARDLQVRPRGLLVFLAGMVAAIVASTLRLHLWFTLRSYPEEWTVQHRRSSAWIRGADVVFAAVLAGTGFLVLEAKVGITLLLVGSAVALLLAAAIIEPATTRAAFGHDAPPAKPPDR